MSAEQLKQWETRAVRHARYEEAAWLASLIDKMLREERH